jgi:hypothetical protein
LKFRRNKDKFESTYWYINWKEVILKMIFLEKSFWQKYWGSNLQILHLIILNLNSKSPELRFFILNITN